MAIRENLMSKIKTALISVSDKSNLKPLLNELKKNNIKIILFEPRVDQSVYGWLHNGTSSAPQPHLHAQDRPG